uniref:Major facilitator superfamily (MFS) profile domain-containing protein n=1 Tax=Xiphophorus couchianus TaxID=32473 RepID=A0A3B5M2Q8_9TELE
PITIFAVAFLTSFGSSMLYGYNLAVVNSPAAYIKSFYNKTVVSRNGTGLSGETLTLMYSLTVSVFAIGGLLGSLIVGMLARSKCHLGANFYLNPPKTTVFPKFHSSFFLLLQ